VTLYEFGAETDPAEKVRGEKGTERRRTIRGLDMMS